ncbi:hypothetical protein LZ480_05545 [Solibacillus sp. MA9]|uniref:DUF4064 domain-containing protein n=1 Tax=Solibacillus palustris TaxID=2908203 RepID=A0ABS9UAJ0_9BACL|nr:hypothetical protein [Solibacillus sp. MA9]MCH7321351.1 hypothetical protein [Solibacillus sp. MA9]
MELGNLKQAIFPTIAAWISIVSGLFILLLFNIDMLTNYSMVLLDYFIIFIGIGFIFAWPAIFSKNTRFLGFWGLGISLFLLLFIFVSFVLGWMIFPFP